MAADETKGGIGARSIFHLNINCRNLDETLAFYERLGFTVLIGPSDVARETGDAVHRGLGLTDESPCRGALMCLDTSPASTILDILEWQGRPEDEGAYKDVRHVGVARIAIIVDELEVAIAKLHDDGIHPIADTVHTSNFNEKWVLLRDPNGIYVQLFEFVGGRELRYFPAFREILSDKRAEPTVS